MERPRRRFAVVVPVGAFAACAWWTAGLRPFTWPALLAVSVAGVGAIVVGTRRRRPFERHPHGAKGTLIWAFVCAVLVGWELSAYLQQPRADHPTLSSLADPVIDWRPARALAFVAWIALGTELSRR